MEIVLCALTPMAMDIFLLMEMNLQGYHIHEDQEFEVFSTMASSAHCGGVVLVHHKSATWHLESLCCHGSNVISVLLVSGWRKWLLVGAYLPPSGDLEGDLQHMKAVEARYPLPVIVLGDFNCQLHGGREKDILVSSTLDSLGV